MPDCVAAIDYIFENANAEFTISKNLSLIRFQWLDIVGTQERIYRYLCEQHIKDDKFEIVSRKVFQTLLLSANVYREFFEELQKQGFIAVNAFVEEYIPEKFNCSSTGTGRSFH